MFKKIKDFLGVGTASPVISEKSKTPPKPINANAAPIKPALDGSKQRKSRDDLIKEMGG